MRLGCFGGSFDPVHLGHLVLAESCREAARLDQVAFVVAAAPPHKQDRRLASAEDRLLMCRLAVEGAPHLVVDDREHRRPGVSYTVDTVRELLAGKDPADEIWWIIGADTLPELPSWREAAALLDLVPILTAVRPGHDVETALAALAAPFGAERVRRLREGVVPMPLMGVSSTEVRRRAREGRSIRYLVPEPVRKHIRSRRLYS